MRGGLTGSQFLEGSAGKERVTFFLERGGDLFQDKLKSEIFNDKINLHTIMFFSVINKNLNCYILTKNLNVFKRWHAVKNKKF